VWPVVPDMFVLPLPDIVPLVPVEVPLVIEPEAEFTEPAGVPVTVSRSSRDDVLVPVLLPPALCMFPCMLVEPVAFCVDCSPVPMLVFVASFVDAPLVIDASFVVPVSPVEAHAPSTRQKTERAIKGVFFILLFLLRYFAETQLQNLDPSSR
jgi:hypothetical protein